MHGSRRSVRTVGFAAPEVVPKKTHEGRHAGLRTSFKLVCGDNGPQQDLTMNLPTVFETLAPRRSPQAQRAFLLS